MSNKIYDILKFVSLIILPFAGMVAAIIGAVQTGGDAGTVIIAIATAIDTFLGTVLTISSKQYWKAQESVKDFTYNYNDTLSEEKENG